MLAGRTTFWSVCLDQNIQNMPHACLPKLRPPKNRMVFTEIPSLTPASKSILVYSKQRIHVIMYTKESLLPTSKLQKSKINPPHWLIYP